MKEVTGAHFKTIFPAYIFNEDCSLQYYYVDTDQNDNINNGWARVKTASLKSRNNDSMWSNNETPEGVYKGIYVKYACGGSPAGCIYPICIMVSDLSKDELQNNDFVVIQLKCYQ